MENDSEVGNDEAIGPDRIQPRVVFCAIGSCSESFRTPSRTSVPKKNRSDYDVDPNSWGHDWQVRALRRVSTYTQYRLDPVNTSLVDRSINAVVI